jgi:hypothetical protein
MRVVMLVVLPAAGEELSEEWPPVYIGMEVRSCLKSGLLTS